MSMAETVFRLYRPRKDYLALQLSVKNNAGLAIHHYVHFTSHLSK